MKYSVWLLLLPIWVMAKGLEIQSPADEYYPWTMAEYIDAPAQATLEQIQALDPALWQSSEQQQHRFKPNQKHIWVRFNYPKLPDLHQWLLWIEAATFEIAEVYQLNEGQWQKTELAWGQSENFSLKHNLANVTLLNQSDQNQVYLHLKTNFSMLAPLRITSSHNSLSHIQASRQFAFAFIGAIATLMIFNLFLSLRVLDRSFLVYVLYQVVTLTYASLVEGLMPLALSHWINYTSLGIILSMCAGGILILPLQFIRDYFELPFKGLYLWSFRLQLTLAVGLIIANLSSINLIGDVIYSLLFINFALFIFCYLFQAIRQNRMGAEYLALGWITMSAGLIYFSSMLIGLIEVSFLSRNALYFGIWCEALLLAMALSEKYRRVKYQKQALQKQYQSNLEATTKSLKAEFTDLERKAITDPLTGLFNRHHLNQVLQKLTDQAANDQAEYSLILLDLDNFKSINDTYGHLAGDYCLKTVAQLLQEQLRKDKLFRFGGEEFLILLEATDGVTALSVAERIRQGVADYPFYFNDQGLEVTISLGVCDATFAHFLQTDIIELADQALYLSKAEGKNCANHANAINLAKGTG